MSHTKRTNDLLILSLIDGLKAEKCLVDDNGVEKIQIGAVELLKDNPILNEGGFCAVKESIEAVSDLQTTSGAEYVRSRAKVYFSEGIELAEKLINTFDNPEN